MALLASDMRAVLWGATLPAVLSVLLLVVAVREPERPDRTVVHLPITPAELGRLPARATGSSWPSAACGRPLNRRSLGEASR